MDRMLALLEAVVWEPFNSNNGRMGSHDTTGIVEVYALPVVRDR